MARFDINNVNEVAPKGGWEKINWVNLKNDKDEVRVRFMAETVEDVEGFVFHDVEAISAKGVKYTKKIDCLNADGNHPEDCPFCTHAVATDGKAGISKRKANLFLELLVEDKKTKEQSIQFWQRPSKYYSDLSSTASRYTPLCGRQFDIVRNGAKGSNGTTYNLFPIDRDVKVSLAELRENFPKVEVIGNIIQVMTPEQMMNAIAGVEDEPEEKTEEVPVRRTRTATPTDLAPADPTQVF